MVHNEKALQDQLVYLVTQYDNYWKPLIKAFRKATKLDQTQAILFLNLFIVNGLTRVIYQGQEANDEVRKKTLDALKKQFGEDEPWKKDEEEEEKEDDDPLV